MSWLLPGHWQRTQIPAAQLPRPGKSSPGWLTLRRWRWWATRLGESLKRKMNTQEHFFLFPHSEVPLPPVDVSEKWGCKEGWTLSLTQEARRSYILAQKGNMLRGRTSVPLTLLVWAESCRTKRRLQKKKDKSISDRWHGTCKGGDERAQRELLVHREKEIDWLVDFCLQLPVYLTINISFWSLW